MTWLGISHSYRTANPVSMLVQRLLCPLFLLLTAVGALRNAGGEKILLSKVQTLTLRHGLKTSHRRVPALPQVSRYSSMNDC